MLENVQKEGMGEGESKRESIETRQDKTRKKWNQQTTWVYISGVEIVIGVNMRKAANHSF